MYGAKAGADASKYGSAVGAQAQMYGSKMADASSYVWLNDSIRMHRNMLQISNSRLSMYGSAAAAGALNMEQTRVLQPQCMALL